MVEDFFDDEPAAPHGGHDYRKLYAAYKAATEQPGPHGDPGQTIKGWTLGPEVEAGRDPSDQEDDQRPAAGAAGAAAPAGGIPAEALADGQEAPYYLPPDDAPAMRYLRDRRRALDGPLPQRQVHSTRRSSCPATNRSSSSPPVPASSRCPPPWRSPVCCGGWPATPSSVPGGADHPRRGPHLRHGLAVQEFGIYAAQGQKYEPVDHSLLLSYSESTKGQLLEEGITEAGSLASWTAAGTAYATPTACPWCRSSSSTRCSASSGWVT